MRATTLARRRRRRRGSRSRRCPDPAPARTRPPAAPPRSRRRGRAARRPAAASTSASYSPPSSLRSRVSTLPRIGENRGLRKQPRQLRDAADAAGADRRRRRPGRASGSALERPRAGRPLIGAGPRASRGSSRGRTAAIVSPSGRTTDMSFALCTARSIVAAQQRVLDLLDEQPFAADLRRAARPAAGRRRLDDDDLAGDAGAAARRAATACACHSASWLPRVPIRSGARASSTAACSAGCSRSVALGLLVLADRLSANSRFSASAYAATRFVADRLQLFGRRQQQLLDDQARDLVDRRAPRAAAPTASARAARARPAGSPRSAARSATTVGTTPRDCSQAANASTSSSTIASARVDLAAAPRQVLLHDRLQVVDVVEEDLVDLAGRRLDVARHGDVDDEQRPAAARPHRRPRRAPREDRFARRWR